MFDPYDVDDELTLGKNEELLLWFEEAPADDDDDDEDATYEVLAFVSIVLLVLKEFLFEYFDEFDVELDRFKFSGLKNFDKNKIV